MIIFKTGRYYRVTALQRCDSALQIIDLKALTLGERIFQDSYMDLTMILADGVLKNAFKK